DQTPFAAQHGGVEAGRLQPRCQAARARLIGDDRDGGTMNATHLVQRVGIAMRRKRVNLEPIRVSGDDVERAAPDRTCRAEYRDALDNLHNETTNAARGNTGSKASTRSSTPPWPGSRLLLSFTPA